MMSITVKTIQKIGISSKASNRLWPSAYSRGAWQYNVELAKEAVHEMGFNEIQFDYVRFPEDAYNMFC